MPQLTDFEIKRAGTIMGITGIGVFCPSTCFAASSYWSAICVRAISEQPARAWAILKLLTLHLRGAWPQVRLIVRADSGFCRWRMLHWCEWASVDYIIGVARNARLEVLGRPLMEEAEQAFAREGSKQRLFAWVDYAAASWGQATPGHYQGKVQ